MKKKLILLLVSIIVLTSIDLVTKSIATSVLKGKPSISVIEGFWNFEYVENQNIAFSIGSQIPGGVKQYLIIGVEIAALIFLGWFFFKSPKTKLTLVSIILIGSGAFGNLIDRVINGHVVDFVHWFYKGFSWPVFNVADAYVTVGMFILIFEFIFSPHYKEQQNNEKMD
ncbi:signal peptidase II [candidate division KSB1 bacterium]|nr:signal peptidase II [candidate division KSB1 bacterium]